MTVSAVSSAGATVAAQRSDIQKASLDYDAFLKLLLQQLKNQDPTNPVDQKETLAQLASFSSVEQTIKLNDKLAALIQRSGAADAAALIGKTAEALTGGAASRITAVESTEKTTLVVLADGRKLSLEDGLRITAP